MYVHYFMITFIGYYFKVTSNFNKDIEVKFNIINLYKSKSLYQ